jgi:hypothetical protein
VCSNCTDAGHEKRTISSLQCRFGWSCQSVEVSFSTQMQLVYKCLSRGAVKLHQLWVDVSLLAGCAEAPDSHLEQKSDQAPNRSTNEESGTLLLHPRYSLNCCKSCTCSIFVSRHSHDHLPAYQLAVALQTLSLILSITRCPAAYMHEFDRDYTNCQASSEQPSSCK